ncbi:helix-turn-helix domain-containing protein [Rossellomorea sp. NPDC071047]|uniref:helix-turn-helix domain-containing protein n=1 Tax=Rossellomorea sp. NPDC071047 TaxID=3390675 RepID=UPI003D0013AD
MAQEDKDYKKVIGSRLHALRIKRKPGYHRVDVAKELNMAPSTYNDYEGGRRGPNGGVLIQFAKYYETTVDYITGHIDDDSPINEGDILGALSKITKFMNNDGSELTDQQRETLTNNLNNLLSKINND